MKRLFALLIIATPLICSAQDKKPVADETEVSQTKSSYTVTTCSDEVYLQLMRNYRDSVSHVILYPNKKDRKGKYSEYVVYFKITMGPKVENFLKNL